MIRSYDFSVEDAFQSEFACRVAFPEQYEDPALHFPVVYLMGELNVIPLMDALQPDFGKSSIPFILVGIDGKDWNSPLSPWAEPKLGKNLGPFAGNGTVFLDMLVSKVMPYVNSHYRTLVDAANSTLAGYSLAGLLTLFAMYNTGKFSKFASLSGSLWFPGFVDYASSHRVEAEYPKIYISLGDLEKETRNPIMAEVDECTHRILEILSPFAPFFEYNSGGHFKDSKERILKGLAFLARE
ncbi:MAG: alpha/beta hydrolase-fold protein [Fibrobacteraceae bacterium]|nr:alpha/beta hydrolase-fold protein [Fibrobacteraceae bacterium]